MQVMKKTLVFIFHCVSRAHPEYNFIKSPLKVMKYSLTVIATLLISVQLLCAAPNKSQSLNKIRLNIAIENESVKSVRKISLAPQPVEQGEHAKPLGSRQKLVLTITGRITDGGTGESLPGVTVKLKGGSTAVTTNAQGLYSIIAPDNSAVLVFSYVGYETQEKPIGSNIIVNVSLKSSSSNLNEVVVVGYGTQKRLSLSSAISSVKAADIENQVTGNGLTALAGQMPGVDIKQGTGAPGSNPVIRIRGVGSFGNGGVASNSPLIVVDGIPLDNADDFNTINPNDIASVDVLKDAASSAIYGARGGNGIILVTTKKGSVGAPKIDFSSYTGVQNVGKPIKMLNRDESIQFIKEVTQANWLSVGGDPNTPNGARTFGAQTSQYNYDPAFDDPGSLPNTNWQNEIFAKNGLISNYQISTQGGSEKIKYFTSGNYFSQDGVVHRTDFKRYTARTNLDATINKYIKVGLTFTPTYTIQNYLPTNGHINGANNEAGTITSALAMPPTLPARYDNGTYGQVLGNTLYTNLGYGLVRSPLQAMYEPAYRNQQTTNRYMSTGYMEITPIRNLVFRSSVGIDYKTAKTSYYHPSTISGLNVPTLALNVPGANTSIISATESQNNYRTLNWDNTLNYKLTVAKNNNFNVLGGYSVQRYTTDGLTLSGTTGTFLNDLVPYPAGAGTTTGTNTAGEYALISLFGRINYDYKSKYILSAAIRNDASSKFPVGHKDGYFPSVSAAWRISAEPFMKSLSAINDLKLRASYGLTGNYPTNPYPYQASEVRSDYNFNNAIAIGLAPNRIRNDDLTWETNKQVDIGLDMSIANSRINMSLDYYRRNTTNLLYSVPVPPATGFLSAFGNVGEVLNQGFEANFNTVNIKTSKFSWTSNFNIAIYRNKVVHIGLDDADLVTSSDSPLTQIMRVGQPMSEFYGYQIGGIFKDQADVDANPSMKFSTASGPGDTKFVDVNGDGKITPADRTTLGSPNPDFTYGITNHLTYKSFDLDVQLQGVQGGKTFYLDERFLGATDKSYNQLEYAVLNRWQSPENPGNGLIPRATIQSRGPSVGLSESSLSRWLYDATYLRVRNVTLSYKLPNTITKKTFFNSVRVYVSAQNLYTFSKYIGYDPDANITGENVLLSGVDYGTYPQTRTVTLGLNIGL
jgi:TonB-linked SusC/RagA family outer membrane protein